MSKITPFLWFDNNAQDAIRFYLSVFAEDSKFIGDEKTLNENFFSGSFKLAGSEFMAMNAGPQFKFNPSISFSVGCKSIEEVDRIFGMLSQGGEILMPLDKYDFSKRYGWCNDKFGLSWQVNITEVESTTITPSFLFVGKQNGRAEEAINYYTALFPNSEVLMVSKYGAGEQDTEGHVKYSEILLDGQKFVAMESGFNHQFAFSEAISLFVDCKDQEEVDFFWNKFINDGGEESQCGWLKDKFGVSWQIVPRALGELMGNPDREKASRVMQAMLKMQKINVAELQKAFDVE